MADAVYREQQDRDRYTGGVRAVNELVDQLRDRDGRGWAPHVAPAHGGDPAWLLSILRDPGPKAHESGGSGFLSIENDDATAEQQCRAFGDVGITAADVTPWNAYPWYINRKPSSLELDAGANALAELLALLPHLTAVLLQGRDAANAWQRLRRRHPHTAALARVEVVSTYHPSRQALWSPDPDVRLQRQQDRTAAYARAASLRPTAASSLG